MIKSLPIMSLALFILSGFSLSQAALGDCTSCNDCVSNAECVKSGWCDDNCPLVDPSSLDSDQVYCNTCDDCDTYGLRCSNGWWCALTCLGSLKP